MTLDERIGAMREFCDRQGFEFHVWRGTQREPDNGISVKVGSVALVAKSFDGLDGAVARMEAALTGLKRATSDAYLSDPHKRMGML